MGHELGYFNDTKDLFGMILLVVEFRSICLFGYFHVSEMVNNCWILFGGYGMGFSTSVNLKFLYFLGWITLFLFVFLKNAHYLK